MSLISAFLRVCVIFVFFTEISGTQVRSIEKTFPKSHRLLTHHQRSLIMCQTKRYNIRQNYGTK